MSLPVATCETPTLPGSLYLQCNRCKKHERELPKDTKLRRCKGCLVTMYCSRECQKAAWRDHKPFCRRPPESGVLTAGYLAPLTLIHNLRRWCDEVHQYAITELVNAAVQLSGGIAANFASPRMVVVRLRVVDNASNPAKVFQLRPGLPDVVDDVHHPEFFTDWARLEEVCRKQADLLRNAVPDPTFAGSLPAMFLVENTTMVTYRPYPIYCLMSLDKGPLNDRARAAFADVVACCIALTNAGFIMRAPPDGIHQPEPDVGVFVQQKKTKKEKWVWEKEARWDWNSASLPASESGLTAHEAWTLYHEL